MNKQLVRNSFGRLILELIVALPDVAQAVTVSGNTEESNACNNAMLKGRYGYSEQGAYFPFQVYVRTNGLCGSRKLRIGWQGRRRR